MGGASSELWDGMSLRDWLASTAPAVPERWWVIWSQRNRIDLATATAEELARLHVEWRYTYADAALAEREKGE